MDDWITLGSFLIGGLATFAGGWFQAWSSKKAQREQNILDKKVDILEKFMGNRIALMNYGKTEEYHKTNFVVTVNSIDVAFRDNENVLDRYYKWKDLANSGGSHPERLNALLYELTQEMYEDVGIKAPTYNQFLSVLKL